MTGESAEAYRERRKVFIHQFTYHISQSGINEINRMTTRLMYLQLAKGGFPISWWTLAKVFKIPNFGNLPKNPQTGEEVHNELETWIAQKHLERELAQEMGAGQPGAGPGRPHSNQRPPTVQSKDHGTRSTVKTS